MYDGIMLRVSYSGSIRQSASIGGVPDSRRARSEKLRGFKVSLRFNPVPGIITSNGRWE